MGRMSQARVTSVQIEDLQDGLRKSAHLYAQTHLAHWNVEGPYFPQLHALFEDQYNELWAALDVIAERIRQLGAPVDASAFSNAEQSPENAHALVRTLADENRALATHWRDVEARATDGDDPATAGLATDRVQAHDQHAWMLDVTSRHWP